MWSRDPQQTFKILAGILKIKTSFVMTLRCHLIFMLSLFCKNTVEFSRDYMMCGLTTGRLQTQTKNQLLSLKPDSKEVCRTVRQHHPPPNFFFLFFFFLEFIVIFIKKMVFMLNFRRKWQATPVSLPRKSHGWRSLAGYSP